MVVKKRISKDKHHRARISGGEGGREEELHVLPERRRWGRAESEFYKRLLFFFSEKNQCPWRRPRVCVMLPGAPSGRSSVRLSTRLQRILRHPKAVGDGGVGQGSRREKSFSVKMNGWRWEEVGFCTHQPSLVAFAVSWGWSSSCPCNVCFGTTPVWLSARGRSFRRVALSWGHRAEGLLHNTFLGCVIVFHSKPFLLVLAFHHYHYSFSFVRRRPCGNRSPNQNLKG